MYIPGIQLLDRFQNEIKFLINPIAGVDSFNFYQSTASGGPYAFFANVLNSPSLTYPYKGKILFQYDCTLWDNTIENYVEVTTVIGGVEQPVMGPIPIPPIRDRIVDESVNVLGWNKDEKRFICLSVDADGDVQTQGGGGGSGISGISGYSGDSGFSGYSGDNPGSSGYSGISGYSGDNPGSSGVSGYSGAAGSTGSSGISGYSGQIGVGVSGTSGYSGTAGGSGASGPTGSSGYSGYSGIGEAGTSGISGYSGTTGTGASGYSGISGYSGTSGISGYSGDIGSSGYSGTSGISGYSGTSGISGYSGTSGISGYSGTSGISGYSGTSGISGYSGTSGISGYSGTSGYSGIGTSGYSGPQGSAGSTGSSGYSGYSGSAGAGGGEVVRIVANGDNTLQLLVAGPQSDINNCSITKTVAPAALTVTVTRPSTNVRYISLKAYWTAGDWGTGTQATVTFPETSGQTTMDATQRPVGIRFTSSTYGAGAMTSTVANSSGSVTVTITGFTASQSNALQLIW